MSRKSQRYADQGVARCPRCEGVMSARMGRDGPYFHCLCYGTSDLELQPPPGPASEVDGRAAQLRLYEEPQNSALPEPAKIVLMRSELLQ